MRVSSYTDRGRCLPARPAGPMARSACILFGVTLAAFPIQAQKDDIGRTNMEFADKSFIEVLSHEKAALIAGEVRRVTVGERIDEVVTGEVFLHVERELTRGFWNGGPDTEVRYAQYANLRMRVKGGTGGWNDIELHPGVLLVLAIEGDRAPFAAVAVKQVASLDDPLAHELEWIAAAERGDRAKLAASVKQAVSSGSEEIAAWGHYSLGPLRRLPRATAADTELEVLLNKSQAEDNRISAATNLQMQLWADGAAADPVNHKILGAFLRVLPGAPEELQTELLDMLHAILFEDAPENAHDAAAYRSELRHSVVLQPQSAVLEVVHAHARKGDAETKHDLDQLAQWIQQ